MNISPLFLSLLLLGLLLGCSPGPKKVKAPMDLPATGSAIAAGPPTILYKTRRDYRRQVAVSLSADKAEIVAYPHPADVFHQGVLAYPTELQNGYLLDNRGIDEHVAFLRLTYAEYSQLPQPPSLHELRQMILDEDPVTEMWDCGNRNRFQDEVKELNALLLDNHQPGCRKIK